MKRSCGHCGFRGPAKADARFCPRCGAALSAGSDVAFSGELALAGGDVMRSTGMAYLLWALCFVGIAGVHRFYCRKYLTGILWLITWGFLGIGLVIDLFLIDGMVERVNRRISRRYAALA